MTWRQLIALAALGIAAFVLFAFVIFPNVYAERHYADIDGALTYTSPFSGRTAEFPPIGSLKYSESCIITHVWEDMSARAYCAEDGAVYFYDSDGQPVPGITANPVRGIGWFPE